MPNPAQWGVGGVQRWRAARDASRRRRRNQDQQPQQQPSRKDLLRFEAEREKYRQKKTDARLGMQLKQQRRAQAVEAAEAARARGEPVSGYLRKELGGEQDAAAASGPKTYRVHGRPGYTKEQVAEHIRSINERMAKEDAGAGRTPRMSFQLTPGGEEMTLEGADIGGFTGRTQELSPEAADKLAKTLSTARRRDAALMKATQGVGVRESVEGSKALQDAIASVNAMREQELGQLTPEQGKGVKQELMTRRVVGNPPEGDVTQVPGDQGQQYQQAMQAHGVAYNQAMAQIRREQEYAQQAAFSNMNPAQVPVGAPMQPQAPSADEVEARVRQIMGDQYATYQQAQNVSARGAADRGPEWGVGGGPNAYTGTQIPLGGAPVSMDAQQVGAMQQQPPGLGSTMQANIPIASPEAQEMYRARQRAMELRGMGQPREDIAAAMQKEYPQTANMPMTGLAGQTWSRETPPAPLPIPAIQQGAPGGGMYAPDSLAVQMRRGMIQGQDIANRVAASRGGIALDGSEPGSLASGDPATQAERAQVLIDNIYMPEYHEDDAAPKLELAAKQIEAMLRGLTPDRALLVGKALSDKGWDKILDYTITTGKAFLESSKSYADRYNAGVYDEYNAKRRPLVERSVAAAETIKTLIKQALMPGV